MAVRAHSEGRLRAPSLPARAAVAFAVALAAGASLAAQASGAASIDALPSTFTGASYLATANVSDPSSVVLYEWDFDGDGAVDVNQTSDPRASFVYLQARPDYRIQLNVTRLERGNLTREVGQLQVRVADGTPTVAIDLPDRLVSGLDLTFSARAADPDASAGGEPFAYRWTLDGQPVEGAASSVRITVPSTGAHQIAVEVTDAEGLSASATISPDFAAAGLFEGRAGGVTLGLLTAAVSVALGLPLVALQRRERRQAALSKATSEARAVDEQVSSARKKGPAGKLPFGASSEGASDSGARIALGGSPASLQKTRECLVCHNAIDAETRECPHCAGNDRSLNFEKQLEAAPYAALDLAEVRAVLQRARRERHLGHHETDRELLAEAQKTADRLAADAMEAAEWLPKAEAALAEASARPGAGGETVERAEAYLKLAHSLAGASQFGKAARHARKAVEFLEEPPSEPSGHGGPAPTGADDAQLESRVRAEIAAVRQDVASHSVTLDPQAFELLRATEEFERMAQWAEALEVMTTLREKLERARDAAAGPPPGPDDSSSGGGAG